MYQTVMILLVTAVITIITTIVTVRVTMTGRVVSQEARSKFSTSARKYGTLVGYVVNVALNSFSLARFARNPRPVDRVDVILASFMVTFVVLSAVGAIYSAAQIRLRNRVVSDCNSN